MTTHRMAGHISISCDQCPETVETDQADYRGAVAEAREQGWSTLLVNDEWMHLCPACTEDNEESGR